MERIKQALERARLERQQAGNQTAAPAGPATSPGTIVYTRTKTIDIPYDLLREHRIICGLEKNPFTDAFKILRTQVLQRLQEHGWNSLAVTSAGVSEGKTITAVNLAISLALEVNYTVLLVDADLRHPSVDSCLGVEPGLGLSDYLTDDVPLSELLVHLSHVPRFVVLPGGKALENSSEMLSSPKMRGLVEELKSRYPMRIIVFDLPPLLNSADALAFSPYVDAALLVVEEGKTKQQQLQHAASLLTGTTLIGTVLNKAYGSHVYAYGQQPSAPDGRWFGQLRDRGSTYGLALKDWADRLRRRRQ